MQAPLPQTEDEIIAWLNARGNGDPDENGISLDQLWENRKLTPTERLLKLENAVESLRELRRATATQQIKTGVH